MTTSFQVLVEGVPIEARIYARGEIASEATMSR
jgi:hypothetical protein